jgi:hypothetical protein
VNHPCLTSTFLRQQADTLQRFLPRDQYERNGELDHGVANDGYHTART